MDVLRDQQHMHTCAHIHSLTYTGTRAFSCKLIPGAIGRRERMHREAGLCQRWFPCSSKLEYIPVLILCVIEIKWGIMFSQLNKSGQFQPVSSQSVKGDFERSSHWICTQREFVSVSSNTASHSQTKHSYTLHLSSAEVFVDSHIFSLQENLQG